MAEHVCIQIERQDQENRPVDATTRQNGEVELGQRERRDNEAVDPIQGEDGEVDTAPRQNGEVELDQRENGPLDPVRRDNEAVDPIQGESGEVELGQRENGPVDPVRRVNEAVDPIQGENEPRFPNSDCLQLQKAAEKGDVISAESFIQKMEIQLDEKGKFRLMLRQPITVTDETVLHVAAGAKQKDFVNAMLEYTEPEDLKLQDKNGNNSFCFAAMAGAREIAEKMLEMAPELLTIQGGRGKTPLHLSTVFGQRDMATFLYKKHQEKHEQVEDIKDTFFESMRSNLYDLTLKLLKQDKKRNQLALIYYENHGTALHMLARNPSAFTSTGNNLINYGMDLSSEALQLLKSLRDDIKDTGDEKGFFERNKEILFEAAKVGNSKFLAELIHFYPNLVRIRNDKGQTIFHIGLLYRHVSLFNLMNDIGFDKQYIASLTDHNGNNLLHLAAIYLDDPRPPVSMVPGAALRMQQELKTFKEVALLVMPSFRESKNNDGLTPRELFTKQHKDLLKEGEAWMKKTSESCMLVATIITTVVFTAAFNVPGDYGNGGIPNFRENFIFCSFAVADAITLSSASLSILIFLTILTSRYEEEDFLKWLPLMLMLGLVTLFVSMSTMMLSFSLSFFLDYRHTKASYKTIPAVVCTFVFGPALSFLFLQRGLLKDIFLSSFRPRFSLKPIEY